MAGGGGGGGAPHLLNILFCKRVITLQTVQYNLYIYNGSSIIDNRDLKQHDAVMRRRRLLDKIPVQIVSMISEA